MKLLDKLAGVDGHVSIVEGIIYFDDGSTADIDSERTKLEMLLLECAERLQEHSSSNQDVLLKLHNFMEDSNV